MNEDLKKKYQNRINDEDENWFTDGGCINNGKKDAIAAFAVYGQNEGIEISGMLEGEYQTN